MNAGDLFTLSDHGISRLALAVARQAAQDLWCISDEAWMALQLQIEQLRYVGPAELGVGSDLTTDDVPEAVIAGLRTFTRNLGAVFTTSNELPMIAAEVAAIVGNPNLTLAHWERALEGRKGDPSVVDMRLCAELLREGETVRDAASLSGVSKRQAEQLSRFLGVATYRYAAVVEAACDAIEEGLGVRAFWRLWNQTTPPKLQISLATASKRYKDAQRALGQEPQLLDLEGRTVAVLQRVADLSGAAAPAVLGLLALHPVLDVLI
jgi:hypothetical protein